MLVSSVPFANRCMRSVWESSCWGSTPWHIQFTYKSYAGSPSKQRDVLLKISCRRPSAHSGGRYLIRALWRTVPKFSPHDRWQCPWQNARSKSSSIGTNEPSPQSNFSICHISQMNAIGRFSIFLC